MVWANLVAIFKKLWAPKAVFKRLCTPSLPEYEKLQDIAAKKLITEKFISKRVRVEVKRISRDHGVFVNKLKRARSFVGLLLVMFAAVTLFLGVFSTSFANVTTEQAASATPDHSFQSEISEQPQKELASIHQPCRLRSLWPTWGPTPLAIFNWIFGFIIESREEALENWAESIMIKTDKAEIENEEKEEGKKREKEKSDAKRALELNEAIGKVIEGVSDVLERGASYQGEMVSMLKEIQGLTADGLLREDKLQEILSVSKEAVMEAREREVQILAELRNIRVRLGERRGGEAKGGEEEDERGERGGEGGASGEGEGRGELGQDEESKGEEEVR
ncbi:hypothetical protein TWF173_010342 [Orbilia oligospora]|nr:hypothetical protein TWF173_010342 [Orbilia oligospora]